MVDPVVHGSKPAAKGEDTRTPGAAVSGAHRATPPRRGLRILGKVLLGIGLLLAALLALLVIFILLFNWNMLRRPIGEVASAVTGREVRIDGDLNVKLFSWTPSASVEGLVVGQPGWAGGEEVAKDPSATTVPALTKSALEGAKEVVAAVADKAADTLQGRPTDEDLPPAGENEKNMVDVGRIAASIDLKQLLKGEVVIPRLEISNAALALLQASDGKGGARANWELGDGESSDDEGGFKLPVIQQLDVRNGQISYRDRAKNIYFSGTVNSSEGVSNTAAQPFRLDGKGQLNRNPFTLEVRGGSLLNAAPDTPYTFKLGVKSGDTALSADGRILKPFDFNRIGATLSVSGNDLADLYHLTGLALPNTPPYQLKTELSRDGDVYNLRDINGRVGDSDLNGTMKVETGRKRPLLTAELNSRLLDFNDLGMLVGAPPESGTVSVEQRAVAQQRNAARRLLPDAPLQVERVRSMDADVTYKARSIKAPNLPLKDVEIGVDLKAGVLKLEPIALTFPQGQLRGEARIDARKDTPVVDVDVRLSNVQLEQFVSKAGGARNGATPVAGTLLARAQLHGVGNSVHRAASTANGTVSVVVPRGEVREAFAELVGINVARGLGLLLTGDQRPTQVRCGVVNFAATNGVLQAKTFVVDTSVVRVQGEGRVDLGQETLDLRIEGKPKEPRLLSVNAPITLQGPLLSPSPGVELGKAAVQTGAAVALGSLLTPLAAVLPFVDPGLAEDANCGALLNEARSAGAPVTSKTVTAPPTDNMQK